MLVYDKIHVEEAICGRLIESQLIFNQSWT